MQIGSPPQVRGKHGERRYDKKRKRITPAGAGKTAVASNAVTVNQDHPRRCGENVTSLQRKKKMKGSPPQVRGKQRGVQCGRAVSGITPAGAGKTPLSSCSRPRFEDHPRRCGENRLNLIMAKVTKGSPPQVRGKHSASAFRAICLRITPAGAGKTSPAPRAWYWTRDHPRRCGENHVVCNRVNVQLGSPPQVRGKPRRLSPCSP